MKDCMSSDLKKITKKIDKEFIHYFLPDAEMETIFVVGSMAKYDYKDRQDNDYDIRVISTDVNSQKIINFENFLKEICQRLTTDEIEVGYSCLVGPVNHKVSKNKKNILIHAMIHRKDQMDDFLPVTHKYQYGTRYRIVYGKDSLKRFQNVRYTLDELLNAHEGLYYCIDMLKKREYRYLTWDIDGDKCEFNFHADKMPEETVMENCFYSTNKFVNNLMNYCRWNDYIIPDDKMKFTIDLLGEKNINEKVLYLLKGLYSKKEEILNEVFDNPVEATICLLEIFGERVKILDQIFEKNEKEKILVK